MPEEVKRMGDYEILSTLGAGGMGRVYKVRNVITDRVEAMKVLLPDLEGKEDVAARFLREIKLLAALHHPGIASLHTALTINNQLVMVMEFVEGVSLSALLSNGAIPVPDALKYIDQVLDALSYAHQQHIIHRDIKPANMMVTPDGVVKLMDFGIAHADNEPAKLTATGTTLGSINYMSPEQVKGAAVDERSDLYSLGVSLYEMVTGDKPFHGDSNFSIMAAHINQAPTPPVDLRPEMPPGLNEIILTSIAKAPEERFQSADAFRTAIAAVLRELQESKTMIQGSQNTMMGEAAMRSGNLRTAPITASRTPVPTRPTATAATASSARTATSAATPRTSPTATVATPEPPISITPPPSVSAKNMRGLYMGLGALVVLVVLVVAGIYMPSRKKSSVAAEPGTTTTQPVPTPATSTPGSANSSTTTTTPVSSVPASPTPETSTPAPVQHSAPPPTQQTVATNVAPSSPPMPVSTAKEMPSGLQGQIDQLVTRASTVNATLDNWKRAGKITPQIASQRMALRQSLTKARAAMENNHPVFAQRQANDAAASLSALEQMVAQGGSASAGTTTSVAPAGNAAELDEVEKEIDQLTSRAGGVNSSLDNLQRQQAASGLGLRGDMASRQSSMKLNLAKAQNAIEHNDAARAKRYAQAAEADIEALEKFLGR